MRRGGGKETVKRTIDWLQFGQFLKLVVELFTTVRNEFKRYNIGPEILEWLNGAGKEFFSGQITTIAEEYDRFRKRQGTVQESKLKPLIAGVDLDADPDPPFNGATLTKHLKQGQVCVEYRPDEDELYVNSKKVVLWLSEEQLTRKTITGINLQPKAGGHNPLNAAFADWLHKNQTFIPKWWCGKVWYFWGSEWSGSDGRLYVRSLYFCDGTWRRDYDWLGSGWDDGNPAASLAS